MMLRADRSKNKGDFTVGVRILTDGLDKLLAYCQQASLSCKRISVPLLTQLIHSDLPILDSSFSFEIISRSEKSYCV